MLAHRLSPAFLDLAGEDRSKPVYPKSDAFVADINAALVQQILDISEREWKPNVHHDRQTDDLGGCLEVAEGRFAHPKTMSWRVLRGGSPDNALLAPAWERFSILEAAGTRGRKSAYPRAVPFGESELILPRGIEAEWPRPQNGLGSREPGPKGAALSLSAEFPSKNRAKNGMIEK